MKKIYYILALAMVGAMSFTSCSKDEPENPAEETQQTDTEKHFKSGKAVYSLKTSYVDPYFTVSFSYLDAEGKLQNATVSDDAPFELTFDAKIGTKVQVTNLVFTPKAGVDTSKFPECSVSFQYGFDIVDAIDGKTYKSGLNLECEAGGSKVKTFEKHVVRVQDRRGVHFGAEDLVGVRLAAEVGVAGGAVAAAA